MSSTAAGRVLDIAARTVVAVIAFTLLDTGARAETAGVPAIDFLDLDESAEANSFSVAGADQLRLTFTSTVPDGVSKDVEIQVTLFRQAERGSYITVEPSIIELPDLEAKDQRLRVTLDRPVLTLGLAVPELPTSGDYRGRLIVLHAGQPVSTQTIDLRRATAARPVELTVDPPSVDGTVSPWRLFSGRAARFSVTIRNTNDEWQAGGVHLRPTEVTHPEDVSFDPLENLELTWNGRAANDLWRTPSPEQAAADRDRTIGPKQQATLAGTAINLPPGLYSVKLAVDSVNVGAVDPPELTVTLRIRHGVVWPFLVLVAAIVISMIATKGLETQSNLVKLRKRIQEIRPAWLREEPSTLPVVAARAILNQAERRSRSWFAAMFAPDVTSARVEKAAQLIGPIGRIRQIRQRIEDWDQPQMIRNRAQKRLREIAAELNPDTASEKQATEINARLDELEQWLSSDRLYELYWAHLKGDVVRLLSVFEPGDFSEPHRQTADKLRAAIRSGMDALEKQEPSATSPTKARRLRDYTDVEAYYSKAKIIWERRSDDDQEALDALLPLIEANLDVPIEAFLRVADDIAWERLRRACGEAAGDGRIRFIAPREAMQPLQAFQMIEFEIGPRDAPKLTNNYLFKHGLEYRWSLEIEALDRLGRYQAKTVLTKTASDVPRIIQYVPLKGRLHVAVELCREDRCAEKVVIDEPREVAASDDFGWTSAFRFGQVMASVIAAVFAIVSGLGTYYFDASVFGTPQDYIALFIWGAGVDQMKNYVQNFAQLSSQG